MWKIVKLVKKEEGQSGGQPNNESFILEPEPGEYENGPFVLPEDILGSLPQSIRCYVQSSDQQDRGWLKHLCIKSASGKFNVQAIRRARDFVELIELPEDVRLQARLELNIHLNKAQEIFGYHSITPPLDLIRQTFNARASDHGISLTELIDIIRTSFYNEFSIQSGDSRSEIHPPIFELREIFDDVVLARENATGRHVIVPYNLDGPTIIWGEPRFVRLDYVELEAHMLNSARTRRSTRVQSVIFDKEKFDKDSAASWLQEHGFRADKVDETSKTFRFRQFHPGQCQAGSFRLLRLTDGVKAVICRPKKTTTGTLAASDPSTSFRAMSISFSPSTDRRDNRRPFAAVLLKVDQSSDAPPEGADGKRILIPRHVAQKALPDLIGMPVNADPTLSMHNQTFNIGIVTDARINGDDLVIEGYLFDRNLPELVSRIAQAKDDLGCSFEADVVINEVTLDGEPIQMVTHFSPIGLSILLKETAAYKSSKILYAHATPKKEDREMTDELKQLLDNLREQISAQLNDITTRLSALEAKHQTSDGQLGDKIAGALRDALQNVMASQRPTDPVANRKTVKVSVKGESPEDGSKTEHDQINEIEAAIKHIQASQSLSPLQKLAELDRLNARKRELLMRTLS
ncbi:MAG: hypothetical protein V2G41_09280 [bacterium JZ-2024 1]